MDLKARLRNTRFPDQIAGTGWDYGTDTQYLKELVAYWANDFDWRAREKQLNAFHHYRANIDGLGIHFIHEKGKKPNSIPVLMMHGWPSSFVQFEKIIPLLDGSCGARRARRTEFRCGGGLAAGLRLLGYPDRARRRPCARWSTDSRS